MPIVAELKFYRHIIRFYITNAPKALDCAHRLATLDMGRTQMRSATLPLLISIGSAYIMYVTRPMLSVTHEHAPIQHTKHKHVQNRIIYKSNNRKNMPF